MKIPFAVFGTAPIVQNSTEKSRNSASFQMFLDQVPSITGRENSFTAEAEALPEAEKIEFEFQNLEEGILNALQEIPIDEGFFKETPSTNEKVNELLVLGNEVEIKAVQGILSKAVSMEGILSQLSDQPETVKIISVMAGVIQLPDTEQKKQIEAELSHYISQKYPEHDEDKPLFEKAIPIFLNRQAENTNNYQAGDSGKLLEYNLAEDKETQIINDSVSLLNGVITQAINKREHSNEQTKNYELDSDSKSVGDFLHDVQKLINILNIENEFQANNTGNFPLVSKLETISPSFIDNKSALKAVSFQSMIAAVQDAMSDWMKDAIPESKAGFSNEMISLDDGKFVSLISGKLSLDELSGVRLRLFEKISSAIKPLQAYLSEMTSKEAAQTSQMLELIKYLNKQTLFKGMTDIGLNRLESRPQYAQVIQQLDQSALSLSIPSLKEIQVSIKNAENILHLQVQLSKQLLMEVSDGTGSNIDKTPENNKMTGAFSKIDSMISETLIKEIKQKAAGQIANGHKSWLHSNIKTDSHTNKQNQFTSQDIFPETRIEVPDQMIPADNELHISKEPNIAVNDYRNNRLSNQTSMENILQTDLLKINNDIPSLKEKPFHSSNQLILSQLTDAFKSSKTRFISSGFSQMTIRLAPEHLGMLTVKLQQQHGEMTAKIITSTKSAKELVEQSIHQLKQALPSLNIQVDRFEVYGEQMETSFNRRQEENNHNRYEQDSKKEETEIEEEKDSFKAHLNMLT
ncbi:flagellar hook-length control protein FliK [Metabacillus idriensis]|uniref:flagellar hook-length control protein FliK n=1 Tax=Metabacillus idriensis TaxID=324768 RepID=UPI00203F55AC|nr:flagellar hook-length control protein FliK [Metabacillus idriensis]MCM3594298.1 flagellar hook-length control protein FliK [Metabacillus idriensis]